MSSRRRGKWRRRSTGAARLDQKERVRLEKKQETYKREEERQEKDKDKRLVCKHLHSAGTMHMCQRHRSRDHARTLASARHRKQNHSHKVIKDSRLYGSRGDVPKYDW